MNHPTWVWLVYAEEGASRGQLQEYRLPRQLPTFVEDKVRSADIKPWQPENDDDEDEESQDTEPLLVRGVAWLQPSVGREWHDLLAERWSREALFLQESYFRRATDAYTLKVLDALPIADFENLPYATAVARAPHRWSQKVRTDALELEGDPKKHLRKRHAVRVVSWGGITPSPAGLEHLTLQAPGYDIAGSVRQVCKYVPEIAVQVPALICQLLFSKHWFDIVMLARWTFPVIPELHAGLDPQWLKKQSAEHSHLVVTPSALLPSSTADVVDLIRTNAGTCLNAELDDDKRANLRTKFNAAIEVLEAHASSQLTHLQAARVLEHLPEKYLRQVLAALDLRNRQKLRQHAQRFVSCLPEGLRPSLRAWALAEVKGESHLARGRAYLDMAMLRMEASVTAAQPGGFLRYAWGDASSKEPHEVYNSRHRRLPRDMVVELAAAWHWLSSHPLVSVDGMDAHPETLIMRKQFSQLLFDNIRLHSQAPQLLGQGRTGVLDKASAQVHASLLEVTDVSELESHFESYVSWCTDMGVEAGMPMVQLMRIEDVLPVYLRPARGQDATHIVDGFIEEGVLEGTAQERPQSCLMPEALPIPGVMHAVHNAVKDMDKAFTVFQGFKDFYDQVKLLDKFLGHRRRCERFCECVLKADDNLYKRGRAVLLTFSSTLYEQRWSELCLYLEKATDALELLRAHWDEAAYVRGCGYEHASANQAPSREDGWSPKELTGILQSVVFYANWHLQRHLRLGIESFTRWAEGCSCHEFLLIGSSSYEQEKALRTEIEAPSDVAVRCPCMSCRGPHMAAGQLQSFIHELKTSRFHQALGPVIPKLTAEDLQRLQTDWCRAVQHLATDLQLRLRFWQDLPWIIVGGAHPEEGAARRCLREAQRLWDELPEEAKDWQHSLTNRLFTTPLLREELHAFSVEGVSRDELPVLRQFLAPLAFLQVSERTVEASHTQIGRCNRATSANIMSINMRVPELLEELSLRPEAFHQLLDCFSEVRKVRNFGRLFPGHAQHPALKSLPRKTHHTKVLTQVTKILYRDATIQHGDLHEAALHHAIHQAHEDALVEQIEKKEGKKITLSLFAIVASAAAAEVKRLCKENAASVFSHQIRRAGRNAERSMFWTPIILQPSAVRRPRHAPGTVKAFRPLDMLVSSLENQGEAQRPIVDALCLGEKLTMNFLDCAVQVGITNFLDGFCVWPTTEVLNSLPSVRAADQAVMRSVSTKLLRAGAMPGGTIWVTAELFSRAEHDVLEQMSQQGLVLARQTSWQLTVDGVGSMQYLQVLGEPRHLGRARDVGLADLTVLELLAKMWREDWEWKRPRQVREPYRAGGKKVWCSGSLKVDKNYFLCLVDAHRLLQEHQVEYIPHGQDPDVYEAIWKGVSPDVAVAASRRAAARPRQQHAGLPVWFPAVCQQEAPNL